MSIEDLEKKLYSRKQESIKAKIKSEEKVDETFLGSDWQEEKQEEKKEAPAIATAVSKNSVLKIIKWLVLGITLLAVFGIAVAGFYLYVRFSSDQEISFMVSAPENVLTGIPFNLKLNIINNSRDILKNASISIFLPENAIAEESRDKRVFTKQIKDLESTAGLNEEIPLIIFSNGEAIKKFNISFNYSFSQGGKFEKKQDIEIVAKESAIKLDLTAPEKIVNNEIFETIIKYSNISESDFKKTRLNFIYPKNFFFKKSEPQLQDNLLEINLPKNKEGKISIIGFAAGQEQSFVEIKILAEVFYNGEWRSISEKTAKLTFSAPPLNFKIESNAADYAFAGELLNYRLVYYNSSDIGLNDVVIKVKLTGEMFDFLSLETDGIFNSRDNTILWKLANFEELKLINPGSGGDVNFKIKLKSYYPLRKISDKNFKIFVEAEISSPTVPYYVVSDKTISLAELETKIGGQIAIESKAYFIEPTFEIINSGPLPLKADQPTKFTIHWIIKNYYTDIKDAVIKTTLAPGVKFTEIAKSNILSAPVFNEKTNEVSWLIDKIPATKGIVSQPAVRAAFQIEVIPNILTIGREMKLINETSIVAIDEFINKELRSSIDELFTTDLSDIGFDSKNGIVIQ